MSHKAERRPGSGEIWLAVTKHDGVQVDSILIDQAEFGQALRQVRASNFDLPVALGLQLANRALQIVLNKPGVRADRLQRARDDPFRLVPPRRREGVFLCRPFRMIAVPVTHDLIHLAAVDTPRLPLSLLDEVAEERGTWRERHMVDVAVQGLIHAEHEPRHSTSFPHAAHPRASDWVMRGRTDLQCAACDGTWLRSSSFSCWRRVSARRLISNRQSTALLPTLSSNRSQVSRLRSRGADSRCSFAGKGAHASTRTRRSAPRPSSTSRQSRKTSRPLSRSGWSSRESWRSMQTSPSTFRTRRRTAAASPSRS